MATVANPFWVETSLSGVTLLYRCPFHTEQQTGWRSSCRPNVATCISPLPASHCAKAEKIKMLKWVDLKCLNVGNRTTVRVLRALWFALYSEPHGIRVATESKRHTSKYKCYKWIQYMLQKCVWAQCKHVRCSLLRSPHLQDKDLLTNSNLQCKYALTLDNKKGGIFRDSVDAHQLRLLLPLYESENSEDSGVKSSHH